jgi:hypothetical protein
LKQGPDHVDTCKTKLVYKGWWTTCWDRFWRNIFFHCEMGNIGNDFSFSYLIKLGIISLICENHFFEWRKFTWLNLKDFFIASRKNKVCHLKKALFDLRQTPHAWYSKIDAWIYKGTRCTSQ